MLGNKDSSDGQQVFCKFGGCVSFVTVRLTVNHDGAAKLFADGIDKLKCESTQSVSMGDHDLRDTSIADPFQKGDKPGALPVESASNVADKFVVRIGSSQLIALSSEISSLLVATNSGVADLCLLNGGGLLSESEESCDIRIHVETFAEAWGSYELDVSELGPSTKA